MGRCDVCFRHCEIREGKRGFCGARICTKDKVRAENYGKITSLALDPIEKKPLHRFYPGSMILSVGSYGCNLRCPFCQNSQISWSEMALRGRTWAETVTAEELVRTAEVLKPQGNVGVAFTYNEPLVGWEYILDTARLVHEAGMVNVLVTNGTAELHILEKLAPYIDAMNIDLKGFTDRYYTEILGGSLEMVKAFITRSVQLCHVELTTLIVPGENDSTEEMHSLSSWVAGLTDASGKRIGSSVPLHISRFFPRFHMTDRGPTEIQHIYRLAEEAGKQLEFVYPGNVP